MVLKLIFASILPILNTTNTTNTTKNKLKTKLNRF
ncbi:hypothetical protein [Campylobacter phage CJLB-14]|nr:hypothetical protein [Campylobacter phage CJLB-14]